MRKHAHEEERRTRKLKRLIQKLDSSLVSGEQAVAGIKDALRKSAETLESYQAWKRRN